MAGGKSIFEFADMFGIESPFGDWMAERNAEIALEREKEREKLLIQDEDSEYNLPNTFDRGKDGRILFEQDNGIASQGRIIVVFHICFYGSGFEEVFKASSKEHLDRLTDSTELTAWIEAKKLALEQVVKADPTNKKEDLQESFIDSLVQEQCFYLSKAFNEYSHKANGPNGEVYPVRFEVYGYFVSEETAKQYMHSDVQKVGTEWRSANNALFFVRVEPIEISAHNSIQKGIIGDQSMNTEDNSMIISTRHLSTTNLTHELIVHPFWGRLKYKNEKQEPLDHLDENWNRNPEDYDTTPSIRFVDYDDGPAIVNLPANLTKQGTIGRLDKTKRKVLPPDIRLSNTKDKQLSIVWGDSTTFARFGDATNTFFEAIKVSTGVTINQRQYQKNQYKANFGRENEPKLCFTEGIKKALSVLLLLLALSSCGSICQKEEEIVYADYKRMCQSGNSYSFASYFEFDCKKKYSQRYILKKLGKPFRIYVQDVPDMDCYEDWIYVSRYSNDSRYHKILDLLILRFDFKTKELLCTPSPECPRCHFNHSPNTWDHDGYVLKFWNQDSLDYKVPYRTTYENKPFYML